MRRCIGLVVALLLVLAQQPARGHFIWIEAKPAAGKSPQVEVYFCEAAHPGEKELIGKVAHTKAWLRDASGKKTDVALKPAVENEHGVLTGANPAAGPSSLEAFCDYGVYSHGGPGILVQYYAKHLPVEWLNDARLAKSESLRLDVVPRVADGKLTILVTYDGKPVAKREVVVVDPAGKRQDLLTDGDGNVVVSATTPGRYTIRAGNIEIDKGGERNGKKYVQTWHYSTLIFELPATVGVNTSRNPNQADPSAVAALAKARAGRAVWEDFPGFESDLIVTSAGLNVTGHASIDSNGTVTLNMADTRAATWLEEQLASLVQHRMPDGEVTDGIITWADDDLTHPLGRLIDLGDPNLKSQYRLKDDVVMQVNRTTGPHSHFTITVLEVEYNQDGKYLPRSFTMNFFDNKSGAIQTSLACLNQWQRVGAFDLPRTVVEVQTSGGKTNTWRISFTNARLLK